MLLRDVAVYPFGLVCVGPATQRMRGEMYGVFCCHRRHFRNQKWLEEAVLGLLPTICSLIDLYRLFLALACDIRSGPSERPQSPSHGP